MTRKSWVPFPGGVCRVNGHVGRYLGNGMGAYLADAGSNTAPEQRPVRYYKATKPDRGDDHTHASLLPTNEQLEAVARELGLRASAKTGPVIAYGEVAT